MTPSPPSGSSPSLREGSPGPGGGTGEGGAADARSDVGLRTSFTATLLAALAALAAIAPLATDTYLPAFAQMADDLDVSASSVQLTMTTFLVGVALGQLSIGVLSDRFGRRPLLLWGSVLALVASVCTVVAPALPFLLVARFFQ